MFSGCLCDRSISPPSAFLTSPSSTSCSSSPSCQNYSTPKTLASVNISFLCAYFYVIFNFLLQISDGRRFFSHLTLLKYGKHCTQNLKKTLPITEGCFHYTFTVYLLRKMSKIEIIYTSQSQLIHSVLV